jgi:hypothetical protein
VVGEAESASACTSYDLEWWRTVSTQNNGRSIYKPIETAYLHDDSNNYG